MASQQAHSVTETDDYDKSSAVESQRLSSHNEKIHTAEASSETDQTNSGIEGNVVSWASDDDPECPMNWPSKSKLMSVTIVSTWTFLTPLASSMVAPGTLDILREFHSTDATLGSFVVSIFILGYAVGPLLIAPLSEIYGRMPVYHVCNVLFIIWTLACAFAPSLGALLAFRFFEGVAGVCAITIGGGTIADLIPAEKRGAFMSAYAIGPLLGPGKAANETRRVLDANCRYSHWTNSWRIFERGRGLAMGLPCSRYCCEFALSDFC